MVEEQILKQREVISKQQMIIEKAQRGIPKVTQELLRRQRGLEGRQQIRRIADVTGKVQEAKKQIQKTKERFEMEVARRFPKFATTESKKQALLEAKKIIEEKQNELSSRDVPVNKWAEFKAKQRLLAQINRLPDEELIKFVGVVDIDELIAKVSGDVKLRRQQINEMIDKAQQEEITEALQMSIAPENLTEEQRNQILLKRFENLVIEESKKFEDLGYTSDESKRIAEASLIQQKTLSDIEIQRVLLNKPLGEIRAAEQPTNILDRASIIIEELRQKDVDPITKVAVGAGASILGTGRFFVDVFGQKTPFEAVARAGEITATGLVGAGKRIISGQGFPEVGRTLQQEPFFSVGFVGGEIGTGVVTGKVLKLVGRTGEVVTTVIDPRFTRVKTTQTGKQFVEVTLKTGEKLEIPVVGTYKGFEESIRQQAKLAGVEVDAVSAARDLFKIFKKEVVIDKPAPKGEPLESSFFFDPRARLRPSRLFPKQKEAGLIDIASGDISFKPARPQAVIVPKTIVEELPKNLKVKLEKGIPLTVKEQQQLLKFQLTPSGQVKPIGFLSKEPEVTLPKGETLIKEKTVGVTLISGRRVELIQAEIAQLSDDTIKLLNKPDLTDAELLKLNKRLKEETGLSIDQSSRPVVSSSRISGGLISLLTSTPPSVRASAISISPRTLSISATGVSRVPRTSIPRTPSPIPSSISGIISVPPSGIPPSIPRRGVPRVPPLIPKKPTPPPKQNLGIVSKKPSSGKILVKGFDVFVKRKGKWVKVSMKALPKGEALKLGSQVARESLVATFQIRQSKKLIQRKGAFFQPSPAIFRSYKIKKGKKIPLTNTFIQRRETRLGTGLEVREIQRARRTKSIFK